MQIVPNQEPDPIPEELLDAWEERDCAEIEEYFDVDYFVTETNFTAEEADLLLKEDSDLYHTD